MNIKQKKVFSFRIMKAMKETSILGQSNNYSKMIHRIQQSPTISDAERDCGSISHQELTKMFVLMNADIQLKADLSNIFSKYQIPKDLSTYMKKLYNILDFDSLHYGLTLLLDAGTKFNTVKIRK